MGKTKIVTRSRSKRNKNNVEENAVENSPKRISISVQDQTEQVNIATEAIVIVTIFHIVSRTRRKQRLVPIDNPNWVRPCQLGYDVWLVDEAPSEALSILPERAKEEFHAL